MSAPRDDDLERRLTELFAQRAATVTQARPVDLGRARGNREAAGPGPGRDRRSRQYLGVLAAAAAVFVAIAATVLGIQAGRHQPVPPLGTASRPTGEPTAKATGSPTAAAPAPDTSCWAEAPASWLHAIAAGALDVDRTLNTVVSAPSDRTSPVYSDPKLTLYHGTRGHTIYTPAGNEGLPEADPTGAIFADWVAFAVTSSPSAAHRSRVMLYQRGTGTLRVLAGQPNPEHKLVRGAPVIAAGKVYWLAAVDDHPETTTLESWDLSGASAGRPVDAADASGLVSYGSGVALVYESVSGTSATTTALRNGAGVPLSRTQLAATAGGSNYGFDGTGKLSWFRHDGSSIGYSDLIVGGTGVGNEPLIPHAPMLPPDLPAYVGSATAIFPLAAAVVHSTEGILDLRTGTGVAFSDFTIVQAVVGDSVVLGTFSQYAGAAWGSAGLSLVPLSALPPVRC
jgi:hypothetical protein